LKLLEPGSFDVCKNTATPIIVMLGYSEIDIGILDAGMETTEFNDCRKVLKYDRDTNGMLATT